MKKWLFIGLAIVLLLSVLGVNGCGGAEVNPFLEMQRLIPDSPDTRFQVYINDHAKIREIYDIPLPSSDAGDEMEEYIMTLAWGISGPRRFIESSFISGIGQPQNAFFSPIRRQNIGFGPQDVDFDIVAGRIPMTSEAIKGRFNLATIDNTISQYDYPLSPDIDSYHDITLYIWSYEVNQIHLDKRFAPPVFDFLGRGTTLAVQKDYICSIDTPELVKTMIDASQGEVASLADNPDYSLMATALSELGAYSVYLSDQVPCGRGTDYMDMLIAAYYDAWGEEITRDEIIAAAGALLNPYRTFAFGIGEDEEGPFMTIVLIYDNPQQANSDVDAFEQQIESGVSLVGRPWQDMVDSLDVRAEDRSLRIRIRGDIIGTWYRIFLFPDTLLLCGE